MLHSTVRIVAAAIAAAALAAAGALGGVAEAQAQDFHFRTAPAFNFTNGASDPAFNFTNGGSTVDFSWGARS